MESLSDQNVDLINVAIHRLMEEKRDSGNDKDLSLRPGSEDDHLLLSRLLSQLESLKGETAINNPPEESSKDGENSDEKADGSRSIETEEIVKELKEVKRQNTITHWLLSIMIVLTLTWQVSEVSLMLRLKDGLSHPFRSVGSMITGMFKGRRGLNGKEGEESVIPNPSELIPIPELPNFNVTELGMNGKEKN